MRGLFDTMPVAMLHDGAELEVEVHRRGPAILITTNRMAPPLGPAFVAGLSDAFSRSSRSTTRDTSSRRRADEWRRPEGHSPLPGRETASDDR